MLVMWHSSGADGAPAADEAPASDEALRRHLAACGYADVTVGRLCPQCGSDVHGRPWARARSCDVTLAVSVSRSGPHLLTVVSAAGAVGVDVESVADVARRWDPGVVLAPGEAADMTADITADLAATAEERAAIWVAKEAVLKAWGVGLARPMTSFRLADVRDEFEVRPLAAPAGYAAAVALVRR